jgi:hypothetical protein
MGPERELNRESSPRGAFTRGAVGRAAVYARGQGTGTRSYKVAPVAAVAGSAPVSL